jgi:hypothetical protein
VLSFSVWGLLSPLQQDLPIVILLSSPLKTKLRLMKPAGTLLGILEG